MGHYTEGVVVWLRDGLIFVGRPGNAYRTLLMADHDVQLSLLYSGAGGSLGPENS
jgi:hypothetical protein